MPRTPLSLALFSGALLMIAGCTEEPGLLVHKTGSTAAERSAALDRCEFDGIKAVPRALATQVSGGYYDPGSLQCSTLGTMTNCNRVGAVNIPATTTTYDANQELRDRYVTRCLADRGFAAIPKPVCRTDAERLAYVASTRGPQPPAAQIPCVVR